MENSGSIQASLGGRYASALFELAKDKKSIDKVESSLATVQAALSDSPEFKALTLSHVIGRSAKMKAVAALAKTMKLDPLTANFLGVLADNRRLSELPAIIRSFNTLAAHHRGEVTVDVTSAYPLDDTQLDAIRKQLKSRAGRDIKISATVDSSILGGLIVRMGSQMIDSSIKTRLNTLSQAMKGQQ